MAKTELEIRTKQFALAVIELVEQLPKSRAGEVVARQLMKSGTSIGANYREANRAESRDDFIHKIGLATKEASETEYWLELITESKRLKSSGYETLLAESRELLAILSTIGRNSKSNRPQ
jgi:four helix bundle protein